MTARADCHLAIQQQLRAIFSALKQGRDVPPAQHYRCEGYMQAALHLAVITEAELLHLQQQSYREVYGEDTAEPMEVGRLSLKMVKAPVK